jgi:hypothetical protein
MAMEYTPSLKITEDAATQSILIILNCPLSFTPKFERVWSNAKYSICADGGANRLFDMLGEDVRQRYVSLSCFRQGWINNARCRTS